MAEKKSTKQILQRAEETLYTASLGLEHVKGKDPRTRVAGLRNVVVFGRAVTNVLQNLRSVEPEFDEWYAPHVEAMSRDELMSFFYQLRSEILKQGALAISSSMTLSGDPMAVFRHFKPPPRAKAFFIGDNIGGSGWEVETEDGAVEKYYVQLPSALPGLSVDMNIHLQGAPEELQRVPAPDLCEAYLDKLSALVKEAKARFLKHAI
jgi:hypothetical protein